jgi:hypothetical protein
MGILLNMTFHIINLKHLCCIESKIGFVCVCVCVCFFVCCIYMVSQEERSIFWEVIVSVIQSKSVCMYMCPVSLYSSFDLVPNVVLPFFCTVPLCEACESV